MAPHRVLFDGECPLCRSAAAWLRRLDWTGCLRFFPMQSPEARSAVPSVPVEQLQQAIHCVTADGRLLRGAAALRFMGLRLPMLVLPALLLYLPGMLGLAEKLYRWIARHRHAGAPTPACSACAKRSSPS